MTSTIPPELPSLTDVADAFRHWRSERTSRGPTPMALRSQSIALLPYHTPSQITSALGINAGAFRQWVVAANGPTAIAPARRRRQSPTKKTPAAADFVELPTPVTPVVASPVTPTAVATELTVDLPDGTRLSARSAACAEQLLGQLNLSGARP